MCYGRLVFAEMPLEIRQYETDTHSISLNPDSVIAVKQDVANAEKRVG